MTDEVITHLAMAGPDRLRPAAEVPGVVLELVHSSSPEIRSTQVRVGAPHDWSSTAWTGEQWRGSLGGPHPPHRIVPGRPQAGRPGELGGAAGRQPRETQRRR